jgi:hypothetical protein
LHNHVWSNQDHLSPSSNSSNNILLIASVIFIISKLYRKEELYTKHYTLSGGWFCWYSD